MKKSTWLIILLHAIYWAPALATSVYILLQGSKFTYNAYMQIPILCGVAAFYIAYFLLFQLISVKKFGLFILYSLLTITGLTITGILLVESVKHPDTPFSNITPFALLFNLPARALSSIFIACILRGAINWYTDIRYKQQLEKKNLETSLALLKARINPHFLFNTLNNIDVLIEKDPTTASVYLKKLSDILRFTLYESPAETVTLQQEVSYIEQYLDLQKIRTANPDFVKFEVKGDMKYVEVAPMLFIPFIENAFKHSTNKKISNAVTININSDGNSVTFECSNAYEPKLIETEQKGGLGLELIKNRLELLYRNRYHLDIDKTAERFIVKLKITLHAN